MAIRNTALSFEEIDREFSRAKKIFFIGIGGISMSALAEYCVYCGKSVFGCDKTRGEKTKQLEKICTVKYYSTPDNVTGMDMVIYTNAIDESNFEYKRAKKLKMCLISRANFLGYVAQLHKYRIGISGMHGKSTTTALLGQIFEYACKNPTVFCGAEMKEFNSSCKFGGREYCIFEACEYQNSFLSLPVTHSAVLNIELDHPDFFSSLDEIKKSFKRYTKPSDVLFLNSDDENAMCIDHPNTVTFGFSKNAVYRAEILEKGEGSVIFPDKSGTRIYEYFSVYKKDTLLSICALPLCGEHFVKDALCAFAIAHSFGIAPNVIAYALENFKGSERRMDFVKKLDTGADVFEDYAHHPSEISASLSSFKRMGYKRILTVFQPHTYSRTFYLYKEFTRCFENTSDLIIVPIYSAREVNLFEMSEEAFAKDCKGQYISDEDELIKYIFCKDWDCVVLMGAGDIAQKVKKLLK